MPKNSKMNPEYANFLLARAKYKFRNTGYERIIPF